MSSSGFRLCDHSASRGLPFDSDVLRAQRNITVLFTAMTGDIVLSFIREKKDAQLLYPGIQRFARLPVHILTPQFIEGSWRSPILRSSLVPPFGVTSLNLGPAVAITPAGFLFADMQCVTPL